MNILEFTWLLKSLMKVESPPRLIKVRAVSIKKDPPPHPNGKICGLVCISQSVVLYINYFPLIGVSRKSHFGIDEPPQCVFMSKIKMTLQLTESSIADSFTQTDRKHPPHCLDRLLLTGTPGELYFTSYFP